MNLGSTAVSLGGITLGTIIVVLVGVRWYKKGGGGKGEDGGGRDWKQLLPFTIALAFGILAVLAAGPASALGLITRLGLWGGDSIGTLYLVYGVGGTSPDVTRAAPVILTPGGNGIFAIWVAVMIALFIWSKKLPRLQTLLGILAGVLLGLSQGIAGMAAVPLASAVNAAGGWYAGVVQ
ncbi:hypothetical protein PUR49_05425 [Streptomyces sp. BE147]|uniref:hypothetical protein n=1 Tax=Streptomyces sp. BE147 TaxID=3002524 RepID=UPI002E77E4B0|nr:hypothetical protein [Streptomyces sp. BE147]MEE1735955.1 hypothetical protein [Streptomyces sp. BE147]